MRDHIKFRQFFDVAKKSCYTARALRDSWAAFNSRPHPESLTTFLRRRMQFWGIKAKIRKYEALKTDAPKVKMQRANFLGAFRELALLLGTDSLSMTKALLR